MSAEQRASYRSPPDTAGRRWTARAALLAAAAAVATPLIVAGLGSIVLLAAGIVALGIAAAALWWALVHRGVSRAAGVAIAALALAGVAALYISRHFVWVVAVSAALWLCAVVAARAALRGADTAMHEYEVPAPHRPFIIMNPRSGGGKVARFGLAERARTLGARVALLDGPVHVDVGALARAAVADGADLLGVAGGDGTQALVAAVAVECDVPFLVISAGTRNHFALDLGLDRDDPTHCLDALTDGVELRVDLSTVNGRPFVNTASFGVYAELVQDPDYRDGKTQAALKQLPELLLGHAGAQLHADAGSVRIDDPQAVLISNNPYTTGDPAGIGRRPRLDLGVLGVIGVRVDNALEAASLLRGAESPGVTTTATPAVTVTANATEIPVGVDGEALTLTIPVHCAQQPGALRVRVPRHRPGRTGSRPSLDWPRVRALAGALIGTGTHRARTKPAAGPPTDPVGTTSRPQRPA